MGHIALCDGNGGTVEAKGKRYGVVAINAPNMDKAVITRIQEALVAKGYDPGLIDGEFGPNTQSAVLRFQEPQGMVVDGAVGPETAGALGVSLIGESTRARGPTPDKGLFGSLSPEAQQLTVILMLIPKEKAMPADPTKPGQGLELLLPMLLQTALTGKQLALTQLLASLTAGKPVVTSPPNAIPAVVAQAQAQTPQASADLVTLLVPVLYERLLGKPWPGSEQKKTDAPADSNTPILSRPSVQLSTAALGIVTILQALGKIGLPLHGQPC